MADLHLLNWGDFTLHSGVPATVKIDCDALTDDDIETVGEIAASWMRPFSYVEGVPSGGCRLAEYLERFISGDDDGLLIVDDVLTTGGSMEQWRAGREARGFVIFARSNPAAWITPLFHTTI